MHVHLLFYDCWNGFSISGSSASARLGRKSASLPAEPSVGLIRAILGPRRTTSPNVLDGLPWSARSAISLSTRSSSFDFATITNQIPLLHSALILRFDTQLPFALTLKLLDDIIHHQIHQLIITLQSPRNYSSVPFSKLIGKY